MTQDAELTRGVSDRQAIADLVAEYAIGVDTQDYERLLAVFAPTARTENAGGVKTGIDEIRASFSPEALARARQANSGLQFEKSTHLMSNHAVTLEGDRAHGESYAAVFLIGPLEGRQVLVVRGVRYLDQYVRLAEGWRINDRIHQLQWQFGPVPLAAA